MPPGKIHFGILWILLILIGIPIPAVSQPPSFSSPNVAVMEPFYRDIEKLIAHGLIDRYVASQRPFSRQEFARLTAEAMKNYSRITGPFEKMDLPVEESYRTLMAKVYVDEVLDRLKKEFHQELIDRGEIEGKTGFFDFRPIHQILAGTTFTNTEARPIPNNGAGGLAAQVNPLVNYQEGRHFTKGAHLSFESQHWFNISRYWNVYIEPRFQFQFAHGSLPEQNKVYLHKLYSKWTLKNVELEFGRDNLVWGPGPHGGLEFTDNARGLDMIKLSNPHPSELPSVLKHLGLFKYSLFIANMGPQYVFKNAYLAGWRVDWKPVRFLELGLSNLVYLGGEGSRGPSAGQAILDWVGFRNGDNFSQNRLLTFDLLANIPPLRGVQIYGEGILDQTHAVKNNLGFYGGVYFPRLNHSGTADLRLEYKQLAEGVYRSGEYASGHALNNLLIGDALGPDARGVYGYFNLDINKNWLFKAEGAYEARDFNLFGTNPANNAVFLIQDGPQEHRFRMKVGLEYRRGLLTFRPNFGYEKVIKFNGVPGDNRNLFLGDLSVIVHLDRYLEKIF